jgi:putative transposase
VPSQSLQHVIERLDTAYQKFFSGGGFPKWAKRHEYNSILFKSVEVTKNGGFKLPKLGELRICKDRLPEGNLKTATIVRETDGYYLCVTFAIESENVIPISENQAVGIDMGIAYFLIDSNDTFIENPRHTLKYEKQLRIANRSLSRKQKKSKSWYKQKAQLAKLHRKIARVRQDFLHKQSIQYVKRNSLIVCEALQVKNMVKNKQLSKHISDASWSRFFEQLRYKSAKHGKTFVQVPPNYTSQTCNSCGNVDKANRRTQSKFDCTSCGHTANADVNAAKNILGKGIAFIRQREAVACA